MTDDRVYQTSISNLIDDRPGPGHVVAVAGRVRATMSRGSHIYRALYFNIERAEDLDLLSWLYVLPVTRRGAAIKHLLRAGLPGYLHPQHPESMPLDPQAVRDLVATRARARRCRRRGEPADADRRRAPAQAAVPNQELSPSGTPGPSLEERPGDGDRVSPGDAEVRLDRLLRSFMRSSERR